MRFVKLLYGLLAVWSVIVIIFTASSLVANSNGMAMGSIAAVAVAATAIPYIVVRALEKIAT